MLLIIGNWVKNGRPELISETEGIFLSILYSILCLNQYAVYANCDFRETVCWLAKQSLVQRPILILDFGFGHNGPKRTAVDFVRKCCMWHDLTKAGNLTYIFYTTKEHYVEDLTSHYVGRQYGQNHLLMIPTMEDWYMQLKSKWLTRINKWNGREQKESQFGLMDKALGQKPKGCEV